MNAMGGIEAAWRNAVDAIITDNDFFCDLAKAVTNDSDPEGAARWLLSFISDYLRKQGVVDGPIAAFDFAIYDIESIADAWPMMHVAEDAYRAQGVMIPPETLGQLARFVVERMPAILDGPSWNRHPPVTRALVLADRADTLVGMFAAGLRPNGSKDPFALRRAAKHWLYQVMFPVTRLEKLAA